MVAEERKALNYSELGATYTFMVVAIETSGVFRHNSIKCLKELGRRLCEATGEEEPRLPIYCKGWQ